MRARVKATRAACALCGEPINYDLPHSDPKSFVIDHIESLHEGGADALSNIQAAHRRPATATVPKAQASCDQPSDEAGPSTRTTRNQGAVSLSNSPPTLRGQTVFTHRNNGTGT
ncbi:HNH endonuclease signature motif containing protein [Frondihabitans sp. 4ASC-45]|uniref:HNH endonuclease signature motif containing protein n=1 Tax=Frondihabitans sp. 4ASC-45 TaxID=3111636 RepID=UPI003C2C7EFD